MDLQALIIILDFQYYLMDKGYQPAYQLRLNALTEKSEAISIAKGRKDNT